MEFLSMASAGNGWKMKVANVFVNQQKELFFECECGAKCELFDELKYHVEAKHCYMTNQVGARILNRRESLFATIPPSMVDAQFHGKVPFNPARPPPQTPSTSAAGQSNGRNNVHLIGATTSAAATANKIAAAHSTPFAAPKSLNFPKKIEVTKMEHRSRFPYECTDCRKVFGNRSELKRHKQNCSGLHFRCACCNQSFGTIKGKQGHEYKVHSDIFKHSCSECKRAFKRRDDLVEHRKCHKDPSIKCDFCSKMVCTQYGKALHIKKRHSDRKYHCKLCDGKGFSSSSGNTMHKHYTHKHGGIPAGGI